MKALKYKELKLQDLINAGYETGNLFNSEDVKEAVLELDNWKIYTKQYPHNYICKSCNKTKHIIFSKNNDILCKECLVKKVFGDFN